MKRKKKERICFFLSLSILKAVVVRFHNFRQNADNDTESKDSHKISSVFRKEATNKDSF